MEDLTYILDMFLEDDDTDFGGTAFLNETVRDFLNACDEDTRPHTIDELNAQLKACGIKPIIIK